MGLTSPDGAVLVTGGAGFVGSHFVRLLHDRGHHAVVLDDLSGGAPVQPPSGVTLVCGDIGDPKLVREVIRHEGIGSIAHFAGRIQVGESVRAPELYFDVNVVRTLRLLEAAHESGIEKFLFSSTAAVYGMPDEVPIQENARLAPINPYGATKLAVEFALEAWGRAYGLRWAALRYFNAAGAHPDGSMRESHEPETHLIPLAIDAAMGRTRPLQVFGEDYDTPDGTCIRDYVHVCDLATAHLDALHLLEGGQTVGAVNLGAGRGYSIREVLATTGEVLGRPVPYSVAARREGDPSRLVADPSLARSMLDWSARRSDLATIIEDAARSRGARAFAGEHPTVASSVL